MNFPNEPTENRPAHHIGRERLQLAAPFLGISAIFLVSLLLQLILDAVVRRTFPAIAGADWYLFVIAMVPMYACAMPLSYCFFRMGKSEPPVRRKLSFWALLGFLAICFALTYAGNFIGIIVNMILSFLTGKPIENELADMTTQAPLWANLLFVGILAPIMEEIFYRKLVIDRLRRYGDLPAILLSGLAFGLIHGNFSQFFYATLLGMLFGYIYLHTGDLRYTVVLHMCINLIGGVYSTEMLRHLNLELLATDPMSALGENLIGVLMFAGYFLFLGLAFVSAVIAVILFALYWRRPLLRAKDPLTGKEWVRVLLLNPAIWIFLAVVMLLFL